MGLNTCWGEKNAMGCNNGYKMALVNDYILQSLYAVLLVYYCKIFIEKCLTSEKLKRKYFCSRCNTKYYRFLETYSKHYLKKSMLSQQIFHHQLQRKKGKKNPDLEHL